MEVVMDEQKTQLMNELDAARDELWALLEAVDPDADIYPGWKKREFFTHIGGWEAMVYTIFRDYTARVPVKNYPYNGVDECNARFVADRRSLPLDDAKLECEINRFAIKTLLNGIPAEQFNDRVPFPWGQETVVQFIRGAVSHERDHAADIRQMQQDGRL
jgi:hypothetical protein